MSYSPKRFGRRNAKLVVSLLGILLTGTPLVIGFWQTPALYGRANQQTKQPGLPLHKAVSCVDDSKSYPEGTIIEREGIERLCVQALDRPMWVRTTMEIRERSQTIVMLPKPPAILCDPRASASTKFCACQNGSYSRGAIVNSAKGRLTCVAGAWRPSTRQELGYQ